MSKRWGLILTVAVLMIASILAVLGSADELQAPAVNSASGGPDGAAAYSNTNCTWNDTVYVAGDPNDDEKVNMGDAVYMISFIFRGGPAPQPLKSGDVNTDGNINTGDAVFLVAYVFRGGPAPHCP